MSDKESLILFLIDRHPSLNNIYGLIQLFDRADFPSNVGETLDILKDFNFIIPKKSDSNELMKYSTTITGQNYLKTEFNDEEILDYIKTMQNPTFLYELTELLISKN